MKHILLNFDRYISPEPGRSSTRCKESSSRSTANEPTGERHGQSQDQDLESVSGVRANIGARWRTDCSTPTGPNSTICAAPARAAGEKQNSASGLIRYALSPHARQVSELRRDDGCASYRADTCLCFAPCPHSRIHCIEQTCASVHRRGCSLVSFATAGTVNGLIGRPRRAGRTVKGWDKPWHIVCAILDDYQNVALKLADWSKIGKDVEIKVYNEPVRRTTRTPSATARTSRSS